MKRIIVVLAGSALVIASLVCVFRYYHPTHFSYNDRFIIGNTQEKITEKYGEFYTREIGADGQLKCGIYMIRDDTPELIMGYDNSLWYEIYFENGVAAEVCLRRGYIGG